MPLLIALRAMFGGALGRIGGWIVAGLSVLAVLKWRDWSARRDGRADAIREQETQGAQARRDIEDRVARDGADERRQRLLDWKRRG